MAATNRTYCIVHRTIGHDELQRLVGRGVPVRRVQAGEIGIKAARHDRSAINTITIQTVSSSVSPAITLPLADVCATLPEANALCLLAIDDLAKRYEFYLSKMETARTISVGSAVVYTRRLGFGLVRKEHAGMVVSKGPVPSKQGTWYTVEIWGAKGDSFSSDKTQVERLAKRLDNSPQRGTGNVTEVTPYHDLQYVADELKAYRAAKSTSLLSDASLEEWDNIQDPPKIQRQQSEGWMVVPAQNTPTQQSDDDKKSMSKAEPPSDEQQANPISPPSYSPATNDAPLAVGSRVAVQVGAGHCTGTLRYVGKKPNDEESEDIAGIELDEQFRGMHSSDGTFVGLRLFQCKYALFVTLSACSRHNDSPTRTSLTSGSESSSSDRTAAPLTPEQSTHTIIADEASAPLKPDPRLSDGSHGPHGMSDPEDPRWIVSHYTDPGGATAPANQHAPSSAPANQHAPSSAPANQHAPSSAPANQHAPSSHAESGLHETHGTAAETAQGEVPSSSSTAPSSTCPTAPGSGAVPDVPVTDPATPASEPQGPEDATEAASMMAWDELLGRDEAKPVLVQWLQGMTRVRHVRVDLLGQYRTGKTSLRRSLLNEDFRHDEASSDAIEIEENVCLLTTDGSSEFRMHHGDQTRTQEDLYMAEELPQLAAHLRRVALHLTPQEQDELPSPPATNSPAQESSVSTRDEGVGHLQSSSPTSARRESPANKNVHNPEQRPLVINAAETEAETMLPSSSIAEIAQRLKNSEEVMADVQDEEVVVSIWDCGGQHVYEPIQHLLSGSSVAVKVLVFRADKPLSTVEQQTFRADGKELSLAVSPVLTNLDHVCHRLFSVHFAARYSTEAVADSQQPAQASVDPHLPPVILVGTFADKIEGGLDRHESLLCGTLLDRLQDYSAVQHWSSFDDGNGKPTRVHLISNSVSRRGTAKSAAVKRLCCHVKQEVCRVLADKTNTSRWRMVKKTWLRFERIIRFLVAEQSKTTSQRSVQPVSVGSEHLQPGYIGLDSLYELVKEPCGLSDRAEMTEMLDYFHDHGMIIYFSRNRCPSLDDIVIYDIQWLVRRLAQFIGVTVVQPHLANLWNRLHRHAELHWGLVDAVWSDISDESVRYKLLKIMEMLHLLFPWRAGKPSACDEVGSRYDGDRPELFFMPCALMGGIADNSPTAAVGPSPHAIDRAASAGAAEIVLSMEQTPLSVDVAADSPVDVASAVPHPVFFHLVTGLMNQWWDAEIKPNLQHNQASLCYSGDPSFVVVLSYDFTTGCIRVSLKWFVERKGRYLPSWASRMSRVCVAVRQCVEAELDGVKKRLGMSNLKFNVSVAVPSRCACSKWWRAGVRSDGSLLSVVSCARCHSRQRTPANGQCWFDATSVFEVASWPATDTPALAGRILQPSTALADIANLGVLAGKLMNLLNEAKRTSLMQRVVCDVRGTAHNAVQIIKDYAKNSGVTDVHATLCYWWEKTSPSRDRATLGMLCKFVEEDAGAGVAELLCDEIAEMQE